MWEACRPRARCMTEDLSLPRITCVQYAAADEADDNGMHQLPILLCGGTSVLALMRGQGSTSHPSYLPAPFQQKGSLQPCAPVEEAGDEGVPQLRDFICADARPLRLKRVWIQIVHCLAAGFSSSMLTQVQPHLCSA